MGPADGEEIANLKNVNRGLYHPRPLLKQLSLTHTRLRGIGKVVGGYRLIRTLRVIRSFGRSQTAPTVDSTRSRLPVGAVCDRPRLRMARSVPNKAESSACNGQPGQEGKVDLKRVQRQHCKVQRLMAHPALGRNFPRHLENWGGCGCEDIILPRRVRPSVYSLSWVRTRRC
jgi:hypothetical protein